MRSEHDMEPKQRRIQKLVNRFNHKTNAMIAVDSIAKGSSMKRATKSFLAIVDVMLFVSWVASAGYCAGGGQLPSNYTVLYALLACGQARIILMSILMVLRQTTNEGR